jgi:hypothetical protein
MDRDHAETLSAFFDGEGVDAEQLADSLRQTGAAALLADFAAMRAHEQREQSRPSPEFFDRMAARLRPSRMQRLLGSRVAAVGLAASLLIAVGVGGFAVGMTRRPTPVPVPAAAASGWAWERARAPVMPEPLRLPPDTAGLEGARRGPDRSGPPRSARRVLLDRWQDTSDSVAVEGQR